MSNKVKIHEIAKKVGIPSKELVAICQRSGFKEIKHHSNAVSPEVAEEIRKTAIKKYKPKEKAARPRRTRRQILEEKARKKQEEAKKAEEAAKAEETRKKEEAKKAKELAEAPAKKRETEPRRKSPPALEPQKTVAPPPPRGRKTAVRAPGLEREHRRPRRGRAQPRRTVERPPQEEGEPERLKKRTIVFREPHRRLQKKKIEKADITPPVTVRVLSEKMGLSVNDILKDLIFKHGIQANINQVIDTETVELIAVDHEIEVTFQVPQTAEDRLLESLPEDKPEELQPRPPVIALLGHVDHGKTSILDHIRKSKVAESEDGGITQDIGAWQITHKGRVLTFVDTPGHEAFTAMRARGAQITDVVILVVAADDGVMPQTVEAINHAKAAEVPIVVAINKIDKPEANTMRLRQQLAAQGLNPEDWGGDVGCVETSALTGLGIEELLERTLLEAELLELKANPGRPAQGRVLETRMEEGLGVVVNVLVQKGTLRLGDLVLCGTAHGSIRTMFSDSGAQLDQAGPSQPVAVSGLNRAPEAGDMFLVVDRTDVAEQIAQKRLTRSQMERLQPRTHVTLENFFERLAANEMRRLRVVLKADVQGSLEPLANSLETLNTKEVGVHILHQGIGNVTESDALLADASDAVVIAFRVGIEERARDRIADRGVEVRTYRVIYNAVQEVKDALEGLLSPEKKEERVGVLEIRQLFRTSRFGTIAGSFVREGRIQRGLKVRVVRDGEVIHEGGIGSLRREKDDVNSVDAGYECGVNIDNFDGLEVGDLIECFQITEVKRTL